MGKAPAHAELKIELASAALAVDFERLIRRAERAGISVVVNADAMAILLVPTALERAGDDLRNAAMDTITCTNACGSTGAKVSGLACNNGLL